MESFFVFFPSFIFVFCEVFLQSTIYGILIGFVYALL